MSEAVRGYRPLDDPTFPHGKAYGYVLGCRENCCRHPYTSAARARYARRKHGITSPQQRVDPAATEKRIAQLRERYTYDEISQMTGICPETLQRIGSGGRKWVERITERAVLTAREEKAIKNRLPIERGYQRIHSLMALGYPRPWIAQRCGYNGNNFAMPTWQKWMSRTLFDKIEAVYKAVGDTPADAERDGILPGVIRRTRRYAQRQGWRSPIHYDDDGNLIRERSQHYDTKGAPYTELTTRRKIEALRLQVNRRLSDSVVAERTGLADRTMQRARESLGLRVVYDPWFEETRVTAETAHLVPLIREAGARIDLMEDARTVWLWLVSAAKPQADAA
jgi:hypothetical protein